MRASPMFQSLNWSAVVNKLAGLASRLKIRLEVYRANEKTTKRYSVAAVVVLRTK